MRVVGVKLVALDIDGTILPPGASPQALPSPRLTAAVRALQDDGVHVVVASGRMFPGTAQIARHLGLATPVICQQGCSVHMLDGTMLHEFPISTDHAHSLVEFARQRKHAYEWFNPLRYIASRETPETREYGFLSGITPEYRPDPERSGVSPTGVGIISTGADANGIYSDLVSRYGEDLHVLDFPVVTVAVARDANKGHSLSLLADDLGIRRSEVVAIGDSVNDAPMLAWAGRGIAMPHSDQYAMDAAHEVLAHDGEDGLAAFLETLAG